MDHGYFEDRISAYRDKGLPADEYELIRQHLAECESCRKLHDRLERFDRAVMDNAELGDDLYWEKAAQRIEQRLGIAETVVTPVAKKSAWSGLSWKLTAAAASLVLIAIVAINKDKILNEDKILSPEVKPAVTDSVTRPAPKETAPDASQAEPEVVFDEGSDELSEEIQSDDEPVDAGRMRKASTGGGTSSQTSEVTDQETSPSAEVQRQVESPTITRVQEERTLTEPSAAATRPEPGPGPIDMQESVQAESLDESVLQTAPSSAPLRSAPQKVAASAETIATADTVDRVRLAELESWRAVKDSLEPRLASVKSENRLYEAMKPSSLTNERRGKAAQTTAEIRTGMERQYLEACYQIARLASDPAEIQSVTDRLRAIASNPESPNREAAQTLLDRLAAGK